MENSTRRCVDFDELRSDLLSDIVFFYTTLIDHISKPICPTCFRELLIIASSHIADLTQDEDITFLHNKMLDKCIDLLPSPMTDQSEPSK